MNKHFFRLSCCFFIAAILSSCSGNQKAAPMTENGMTVIPFESAVQDERELSMSDFVANVDYIPLQTDSNCLVGNLWDNGVVRSSKYFFLAVGDNLLQYALDGKFIRVLGGIGGGPGEYNWISDIDVNDRSQRLFVGDIGKINVYDTETGDFICSYPTNDETFQFNVKNDSTLFRFLYNSTGKLATRVLISDAHGDTLRAYPRHDLFDVEEGMVFMIGSSDDRVMYRCGDDICYRENYNDTIFTVTEQELIPRYVFDLGKYHLPSDYRFELLGDDDKFNSLASSYLSIHPIEVADFVFIPYAYWAGKGKRENMMAIYDKRKNECYKVAGGALKNDMDGLFDFRPAIALDDYTLLKVVQASQVLRYAEKNPSVLENERLKNLQEDDNPVLMVVTLKQQP